MFSGENTKEGDCCLFGHPYINNSGAFGSSERAAADSLTTSEQAKIWSPQDHHVCAGDQAQELCPQATVKDS